MSKWIPITSGCEMPYDQESVLVTICEYNNYGGGAGKLYFYTDIGTYDSQGGYLDSSNGVGGFDTFNDWDEGQPIKVIAWMKKPKPYFSSNNAFDQELLKKKFNF